MLAKVSKNFFLFVSNNKWLNHAAKKWGFSFGASQVVAGDNIEVALKKIKELNDKGLLCTLDHLGEFVSNKEEALAATRSVVQTLKSISDVKVKSHVSVKLTQLGLDIDYQFCLKNMHEILAIATRTNNFVTIDMEDYSHCQQSLDILRDLRKDYDNVGTVIQSYLYRAVQDIKDLQGVHLRLVKGAYKESPEVAYQEKNRIDSNFRIIIQEHLSSGSYTAIATHDDQIVDYVKQWVKEQEISKDQFEFQMLYGFRNQLQSDLVKEGYTVRVYVPFGTDWFGYFMRRLAERPQNISFAIKGFFSK
ncbi:L-proline dehydrogenase [Seinonella peptonophila]|uniref:proline dehydrogenase n=1 Tax=Seinonella peptonophila TaxID=112248 RepID=A0A1M5BKM5_9BACL|nr:proline dehydrogenase [Seinonella peptonophila]SHF42752.1 L-proline dehydrogenase [Seinonella peptonophila]